MAAAAAAEEERLSDVVSDDLQSVPDDLQSVSEFKDVMISSAEQQQPRKRGRPAAGDARRGKKKVVVI